MIDGRRVVHDRIRSQVLGTTRRLSVLLLVGSVLACARDGSEVESSAVGTLIEEVRIDGTERGLVPFTLNPVGAVVVAPDGEIAISQPLHHQVSYFDAAGNVDGTFGRQGSGPGAFVRMGRLGSLGDSLWVFDPGGVRVSIISPVRTYARSFILPTSASPGAGDEDSIAAFSFAAPVGLLPGNAIVARLSGPSGTRAARDRFGGRSAFGVIGTDGRIRRILALIPNADAVISTSSGSSTGVPFKSTVVTGVSLDASRVVITVADVDGDSIGTVRVTVLDSDAGDTIFARRVRYHGVPIPREVGDSAIAANLRALSGNPELATAFRREYRVPAIYPPVTNIVIGNDHTIWLEQAVNDAGRPYLVLDRDGRDIGSVTLPSRSRISVAERGMIWAIERNEFDVESLVRYRLAWLAGT